MAKRLRGRKRHIVVDTQGWLLQVIVHPADLQDRVGALLVLCRLQSRFPGLHKIWADRGYVSSALRRWVMERLNCDLAWVQPAPTPTLHHPLRQRWVVERTFAWLGRQRRLSKDYEQLPRISEAWIYLTMSRLMLRRLARKT